MRGSCGEVRPLLPGGGLEIEAVGGLPAPLTFREFGFDGGEDPEDFAGGDGELFADVGLDISEQT